MSARLLQVLRAYLSRPWVWFMSAIVLFQFVPALMITQGGRNIEPIAVLPELTPPADALRPTSEFLKESVEAVLGKTTALDLADRSDVPLPPGPFRVVPNPAGGRTVEPLDPASATDPSFFDGMGILGHTPRLTYLRADYRTFSSQSLKRLATLTQLETLSLKAASGLQTPQGTDADLPKTLQSLQDLRHLDLRNAFGMSVRIPPLPKLETLLLGPNLFLEENLKTLAQHSPELSELVLIGYPQLEMTGAIRDVLGQMKHLRRVYLHDVPGTEAIRQSWPAALPGVSFPRTTYLPRRTYGVLYLAIAMLFPMIIVWMQTTVSFSFSFSRTLPGFRGPHLLPGAFLLTAILAGGWAAAQWLEIATLPALCVLVCSAGMTLNAQPAVDVTPRRTFAIRLIAGWRIAVLGLFLLMVFAAQPTLDAFLTGEFPAVAAALMTLELAATGWVVGRLVRQANVLAERGQSTIPGMVHLDQFSLQTDPSVAQKGARPRSMVQVADSLLERLLQDRQPGLAALLRGGNARIVWYVRGVAILILIGVFSFFIGPRVGNTFEDRAIKMIPMLCLQSGTMFILWVFIQWVGRRPALVSEFVRPVTREGLYRGLWKATSVDLGQVVGLLCGMTAVYFVIVRLGLAYWGVLLVGGIGGFLFLHGFLIWILTAPRLWIPVVAGVASVVIGLPAVVWLTALIQGGVGPRGAFSPWFLLGQGLVLNLIGVALQFWQHRRWQTLELG